MVFDFRLKVFNTVARKLSFTKAAAELFITQPAVTKHIHELEQQLGTAVFKRNGNTIALTVSGDILLRYSEKIFETYAELEAELAQAQDLSAGSLRVAASTTIAQNVLPAILARFKKAYPLISYNFTQGNTDFVSLQTIAEKIDLGIVEGDSHFPQLAYEPFAKDEIVLVTRADGPFAKYSEIKPADLINIPLVMREHGSGTLEVAFKALHDAGINPKNLNIEVQFQSSGSIKQYLLNSDTAAFLSIKSVSNELKYNQLTIIDIEGVEIFRNFQFIQLHGNHNKLTELFKRFCKTHNF